VTVLLGSIPSPSSNGFGVGPLEIRYYGLCYVVAVAAAVAITGRRWAAVGGSRELPQDIAVWGFPAGLIGARAYFVLTSWSEVPDAWWGVFAVWEGGLGLPGGIAAGVLVGVWRLRRLGVEVPAFLDAAAPGLLVAQAIGRVGNWFNQELYGTPTSLPWGLEIAPENRPARFVAAPTFHPTFLYEMVWDVALAAALVWLGRRRRLRPGGIFALYVAGYAAFRILIERLRVDPAHVFLGLRLNLYVMVAVLLGVVVWWVRSARVARPT
jgi:prolipoprotein diacylglyceryl transferase